jgi:DNA-binding HxlR family transcriptional regulator
MDIKKLLDCMKNPVKCQIILRLQRNSILTAKELLEESDSISQATLYRTLKKLEEEKIIEVASQVQKRGTVEKSYKLVDSMSSIDSSIISMNDSEMYANMFSRFVAELLLEFNEYSKQEDIDIAKDGSGFSAISIYATTEELMVYGEKINKILEPCFKRTSDEQDVHTFATIITPPRKEKK